MAELTNLETFVAAVKSGSFAGAARLLGISPAMVGRRIQALEEDHGARLIERTTRAQRLTELGESFFAQAEAVLEAVAELDDLTRTDPENSRAASAPPARQRSASTGWPGSSPSSARTIPP